ncbi:DUF4309 domain-containing protein [Paenibacillus sp. GD4]|uniref:stalk domain-containing protein n=1 Tax=Paenibacillus sp. GD4 TaxID=3068890 RepID=UPI0027965709|nr:DUF4309 domain-containing protein [Paenibacillus sp. GD4]MDQ1910284.1 DUF4309 domain-containing protein [Paenibacillus sp. GD4]
MVRKFVLGLACGIGLTAATAVYASDLVQVYLFPSKYVINGQLKEPDGEYATLNHNGHAYVPVRWVAENLGKLVKYEQANQTITIEDTNLSKPIVLDKEFLTIASKGKIKGIEYGIGANREEVIRQWGEPHQAGSWQTSYLRWHHYYYFFWEPEGNAGAIRIAGDAIPYRLPEVRELLGKPTMGEGEGVDGGWSYVYQAGEYQVFFHAESAEGKVTYITLKKK